jgi:hypothetical protein
VPQEKNIFLSVFPIFGAVIVQQNRLPLAASNLITKVAFFFFFHLFVL